MQNVLGGWWVVVLKKTECNLENVCVMDLQKVLHCSSDAIITVKTVTNELLLHLDEQVLVRGW